MAVTCEMAKMVFIKFGHLEKRVKTLEEVSAEQVEIIRNFEKKLEEKSEEQIKNLQTKLEEKFTEQIENLGKKFEEKSAKQMEIIKNLEKKLEEKSAKQEELIENLQKKLEEKSAEQMKIIENLQKKLEEKSSEQVEITENVEKELENVNIESPRNEILYGDTTITEVEEEDLNVIEMSSDVSHQNSKIPAARNPINIEEILSRNLVVHGELLDDVEIYIAQKPMIESENLENENIQQNLTCTPIISWSQTSGNDELQLPPESDSEFESESSSPTPEEIEAEKNDPTFNPSKPNYSPIQKRRKNNEKMQRFISKFGSKYTKKVGQKSFACSICSKVFSGAPNLRQHVNSFHYKSFKCTICQKLIGTQQSLDKHLLTNHKIVQPRQGQRGSGKGKTIKKSGLKIDENIKVDKPTTTTTTATSTSTKVKPHKCETCGKYYTNVQYLRLHQKMHTGDGILKCDICPKSFTLRGNLDAHRRVHTGEQPFSCQVCGKKFSQKSNLETHSKNVHSEGPQYGCWICLKKFDHKENLQNHILSHSNYKMN